MKEKLQQIREKAIAEIEGSDGLDRLNEVRQAVLGKKGELTAVLKGMKDVAPEDRPKVGQWVNDTRTAIETIMEEKMKKLEAEALRKRYEAEKIDVTMPAVNNEKGQSASGHTGAQPPLTFLHPWDEVVRGNRRLRPTTIIHGVKHTAGSSGERYAGYILPVTGIFTPHPDVCRTDSCDGGEETADQDHLPGQGVPFR